MKRCKTCKRRMDVSMFKDMGRGLISARCLDCIYVARMRRDISRVIRKECQQRQYVLDLIDRRLGSISEAACKVVGVADDITLYSQPTAVLVRVLRAMPRYTFEEHMIGDGEGPGGISATCIEAMLAAIPYIHAGVPQRMPEHSACEESESVA